MYVRYINRELDASAGKIIIRCGVVFRALPLSTCDEKVFKIEILKYKSYKTPCRIFVHSARIPDRSRSWFFLEAMFVRSPIDDAGTEAVYPAAHSGLSTPAWRCSWTSSAAARPPPVPASLCLFSVC